MTPWSDAENAEFFGEPQDDYRERELMEPALMTALRHAWEGNHKAAESYALLAADKLEKRGEANYAKYLRMAVDEMTGRKPAVSVHVTKA